MWTQVNNGLVVDEILKSIGIEFGISFQRPSVAMASEYRSGEWFYNEHGALDTRIMRWGTGEERTVKGPFCSGPPWSEQEDTYRARLAAELRAAVRELM